MWFTAVTPHLMRGVTYSLRWVSHVSNLFRPSLGVYLGCAEPWSAWAHVLTITIYIRPPKNRDFYFLEHIWLKFQNDLMRDYELPKVFPQTHDIFAKCRCLELSKEPSILDGTDHRLDWYSWPVSGTSPGCYPRWRLLWNYPKPLLRSYHYLPKSM